MVDPILGKTAPSVTVIDFKAMDKKKIIYALIMVFSFSSPLFAQSTGGTLEVLIENAEEDEIYGAEVCVYIHERLVTKGFTDPSGFSLVPALSPGEYLVEIRCVGYYPLIFMVEVSSNQTTNIRTSLVPAIECLWTITTETIQKPLTEGIYGGITSWSTEEILKMPIR